MNNDNAFYSVSAFGKYLYDKQHVNDNYKNAYHYFLKIQETQETQKEMSIEDFDNKLRELIDSYSHLEYEDDIREKIVELKHFNPKRTDENIILLYRMMIKNNDIIGFEMLYDILPKKYYDFYVEESSVCDCCRDDANSYYIYTCDINITCEMIDKMFSLKFIDNKDVNFLANILKNNYEYNSNGDYIIDIFMKYDDESLIKYNDIHGNNILTLLIYYLIDHTIIKENCINLLNKLYKNGCRLQCIMREYQLMLPHDEDLIKECEYKYDTSLYDYDGMYMPKQYDKYMCIKLYKQNISFDRNNNEFYYEIHNYDLHNYDLHNKMNDIIKMYHGEREAKIANSHSIINKRLAVIDRWTGLMLKLKRKI